MSLSLLLQQCPACLVRLTCIVFMMGGKCPYSWCLVGCCRQDLFNLVEVRAFGFVIWDFESIFYGSFNIFWIYCWIFLSMAAIFLGAVINEELSTYRDLWIFGRRQVVILLILIMKRITDRMLPWGIPVSFGLWSELFVLENFNLLGSVLWSWGVCLVGWDLEYAVWPQHATLMSISMQTIWAMVLLLALKPA